MVKLLELLICRLYQLGNRITGVFHEASQSIKGGGEEPSIVGLCYLTNKLRDSQGIPYNQIFGRLLAGVERSLLTMALTCPSCGNESDFQVKTLQLHVVQVVDDIVGVSEEARPAVLEVLCDECESELDFREVDDTIRREILHILCAQ